jgi:hypothetical protein
MVNNPADGGVCCQSWKLFANPNVVTLIFFIILVVIESNCCGIMQVWDILSRIVGSCWFFVTWNTLLEI